MECKECEKLKEIIKEGNKHRNNLQKKLESQIKKVEDYYETLVFENNRYVVNCVLAILKDKDMPEKFPKSPM